ncbi:putative transcriptional regulatory protein pdtaR [Legionella massiliensis]|uniref:Putative transcriptional regulatory protein pdtaR n=1 Tax=Legionella massiliensis TaxID=1034943 RepID=A0A078KXB1_9GAMM|nr:response regulator [Legionella massiliensis]CDZ77616.1 putative transcriptional regulatory protein pdtaR [Legionella massiliensis]CEE13354.1 putative transcriptional regulatory protein pdtaR [Legionella massiliensis]
MNAIHILVVEDSKIAQMVMKTNLVEQGCIVDIAADAQGAIEKAQGRHYDVILMDIGLGNGPDGFDTAAQIKAHSALNRKTSIAAVSVYSDQEYRDKAGAVGMVGYFNKPFTQKHAEKIVSFVRNSQLIRVIDHMK